MNTKPMLMLVKAEGDIKNRAGLTLTPTLDKRGFLTHRHKRVGQDAPAPGKRKAVPSTARAAPSKPKPATGKGRKGTAKGAGSGTRSTRAAAGDNMSRTLAELEHRIPPEMRVADEQRGPRSKRRPPGHERYLDLDLDKAGGGFPGTQADIDRIWQAAVENSGAGGKAAVASLPHMRPKGASFWDEGLRLPDRARYWYEVSAEAFDAALPELTDAERKEFVAVVAATSPQANPYVNLRRAVGSYSQHLRGEPIEVDMMTPGSVREALAEGTLSGLKIGSFGGTMNFIQGRDPTRPLSTNDRQVAATFNIDGTDIMKKPALYEVLSRFYIGLRDHVNSKLPAGADKYETWQLQALGWVQQRYENPPPSGEVETSDDYLHALSSDQGPPSKMGVLPLLARAGVVPEGTTSLTRDQLRDKRVAPAMSTTLETYKAVRQATIEINTLLTPEQEQAYNLFEAAVSLGEGGRKAAQDYLSTVTAALGKARKSGVFSALVSVASGKTGGVTRIEIPTSKRPYDVAGTFEGVMSPNIRVPMGVMRPIPGTSNKALEPLSDDARGLILATIGKAWRQAGMAASHYEYAEYNSPVPEDAVRTYSLFIETTDDLGKSPDTFLAFQKELPPGHELSVKSVPNGYVVDITPAFGESGPAGPHLTDVEDAIHRGLTGRVNTDKVHITPRNFRSDYHESGEYDGLIDKWKNTELNNAKRQIKALGVSKEDADAIIQGVKPAGKYPAQQSKRAAKIGAEYRGRINTHADAYRQARRLALDLREAQITWADKNWDKINNRLEQAGKPRMDAEVIRRLRAIRAGSDESGEMPSANTAMAKARLLFLVERGAA